MAKCVPGMPCYGTQDVIVYKTYPKGCETTEYGPFTLPLQSGDVIYVGPALPNSEIANADTLTVALQKLDNKLTPEEIFNALISAIDNDPALKTILCTKIGECP